MPTPDDVAAAGESTAVQGQEIRLCRNGCGRPVPPAKRKGITKVFCCDRCRSAFREKRTQAAIQRAIDLADEAAGILAQQAAAFEGVAQLLRQFQVRPRRRATERTGTDDKGIDRPEGGLYIRNVGGREATDTSPEGTT